VCVGAGAHVLCQLHGDMYYEIHSQTGEFGDVARFGKCFLLCLLGLAGLGLRLGSILGRLSRQFM